MISVLTVDNQEVVRCGVKSLLRDTEIIVTAEADSSQSAVCLLAEREGDFQVVLIEIFLPDGKGLNVLRHARGLSPPPRVVVLSAFSNPSLVARAALLGANEYILKSAGQEVLRASIRAAALGQPASAGGLLYRVQRLLSDRSPNDELAPLSPREIQVLRHIALGLSNKEIAVSLGISIDTVKEHVSRVLQKVGTSGRTQAAIWAVRKGLV